MSREIERVECLAIEAWIEAQDVLDLLDELDGDLPEWNFLEELHGAAKKVLKSKRLCACGSKERGLTALFCAKCGARLPEVPEGASRVQLSGLTWCGAYSDDSYHSLLETIGPKIRGTVDAVVTWDGGELQGLRIRDGVVEKCNVVQTLVPYTDENEGD